MDAFVERPRRLLDIAGAPRHPSPLAASALVVIDAQLEYLTGALPLKGIDAAVREARRVLDRCREHGVPVFHVVHHGRAGAAAFDPQGPYAGFIPPLAPIAGETTIVKSLPNAFAKTMLHEALQATGRKELVIVGFATHMCVSATARVALDLGYRTTIVAAATATRDLPSATGDRVTPAEVVFEGTLAALADRFAVVVPDAAALER